MYCYWMDVVVSDAGNEDLGDVDDVLTNKGINWAECGIAEPDRDELDGY